jgi:hypothetical protein
MERRHRSGSGWTLAAVDDAIARGGSDDTPAAYRKLVEDYYRALAKEKKR